MQVAPTDIKQTDRLVQQDLAKQKETQSQNTITLLSTAKIKQIQDLFSRETLIQSRLRLLPEYVTSEDILQSGMVVFSNDYHQTVINPIAGRPKFIGPLKYLPIPQSSNRKYMNYLGLLFYSGVFNIAKLIEHMKPMKYFGKISKKLPQEYFIFDRRTKKQLPPQTECGHNTALVHKNCVDWALNGNKIYHDMTSTWEKCESMQKNLFSSKNFRKQLKDLGYKASALATKGNLIVYFGRPTKPVTIPEGHTPVGLFELIAKPTHYGLIAAKKKDGTILVHSKFGIRQGIYQHSYDGADAFYGAHYLIFAPQKSIATTAEKC